VAGIEDTAETALPASEDGIEDTTEYALPVAECPESSASYEEDNEAGVEDRAEDAGQYKEDNHSSLSPAL
jgi:hypothetical protein